MTNDQLIAIRKVASIILDTVKESGPLGAPGGILYAGLMQAGCTLDQFNQIMGGLVRAGKVTKDGECYIFKAAL